MNGVKSKPFMCSRSIRQGCSISPMLYILATDHLHRMLKVNPIPHGIALSGATTLVKHSAYADDVTLSLNVRPRLTKPVRKSVVMRRQEEPRSTVTILWPGVWLLGRRSLGHLDGYSRCSATSMIPTSWSSVKRLRRQFVCGFEGGFP